MTVVETDRIEMAESGDRNALDEMFQGFGRDHFLEGYRVEIVGGAVFLTPQRSTHWQIIRRIVRALEDRFGMDVMVLSDVRIDFPGHQNGFCPDVAKLKDGAKWSHERGWHYEDVEFVAEVISNGTAANDYGPKKTAYAIAEVPVLLIADPYQGKCHLYTQPKDGEYLTELSVTFGSDIDMTSTPLGLTLKTDEFPRD
ncbi:Uma2 family endonuclease [Streptomyces sp. TLI_55]|uniref:Uma2 family endonuclease n=1 Tax=Streptomyces sp. TLI_55 TaxID=1938861 RepID=UPI000BD2FA7F|nr:Uma2 family endonuclease [Streptomyces sp. TLI_55]SNX62033.1 Uma2 family endonuclease [Streptomyces sp. TLI_55]